MTCDAAARGSLMASKGSTARGGRSGAITSSTTLAVTCRCSRRQAWAEQTLSLKVPAIGLGAFASAA